MEGSHNTVENTISAEKKKRSRKKTDQPKDIKPDVQESVDMKEFEKRKLTHHMEKTIRLDHAYYGNNRQELEDILKELNDTLGNAAITLSADENTVLKIEINMDKYLAITHRKAGRKKKSTGVTIDEINQYRETHTLQETFEWLGLTKQTYYRKLREHKKAGHEGSVEF